jgi:hypothetical protein
MKAISVSSQSRRRPVLFIGLVLLPPLVTLALIRRLAVNVPYWDEWELVPLIVKMRHGTLAFGDFWMQHNEHRLVFPRMVMLGLAWPGWNVINELYASWIFAILTGLVLWRLLARTLGLTHAVLLAPLAVATSLLLFSPVQGQNWLWGWQVQWFMLVFFSVLTAWALARWPGQWRGLGVAALASMGATYSLASGQLIWLVGLLGLFVQWKRWGWRKMGVWVLTAGVCIGAYLYGYHSPQGHPSLFFSLQHPFIFATYVLAYLGSPLGSWGGLLSSIAAGYGLAGLGALGLALLWFWRARSELFVAIVPWLQIAAFSLMSAVITAIGRAGFGVGQALSSRYATIALLFWLGVFVVGSLAFREFFARRGRRAQWVSLVVIACVSALALAGYGESFQHGLDELETLNGQLLTGLSYLDHYDTAPDSALVLLYPAPGIVRERSRDLDTLDDGPFNPRFAAENRALLASAETDDVLVPAAYAARIYPDQRIALTLGDASTVKIAAGMVAFTSSGPDGMNFYVDAAGMQDGNWLDLPFFPPRVIDVQTQATLNVTIYWNTGAGLNEEEKTQLYGVTGADGWKHFHSPVWTRLEGFRVDLHYPTADPTPDNLRIVVYDRLWP